MLLSKLTSINNVENATFFNNVRPTEINYAPTTFMILKTQCIIQNIAIHKLSIVLTKFAIPMGVISSLSFSDF
ncbi:18257_t:CDS:1, partial [Funneliformis geosporum]